MIVEKPFGTDLASARALNATIHGVFDESQIFRIDHFLGKESVDNILALRFANGLFEPIWNRDHVSHVHHRRARKRSRSRAAPQFFEGTGTFRDMIVTHLLQVLGFVAMEPPTALAAKQLRDEKVEGLRGDQADRSRRTSCAGSTRATAPSPASTRRPTPRRSSR